LILWKKKEKNEWREKKRKHKERKGYRAQGVQKNMRTIEV
jgi:hypothetical protein